MDEDSLTQEGLDASAIAVGGSFDQDQRLATIARESGWHEIDHELEQLMSEVEEADPSPAPKAVISRVASPPVQQSKSVRIKLSDLLYGNAGCMAAISDLPKPISICCRARPPLIWLRCMAAVM